MESLSQPMSHNAALFFQFANASFDKAASGPLRFHVWPESVFWSIFIELSFRVAEPQ